MALIFFDGFESERKVSTKGWTHTTNQQTGLADNTVKRTGEASFNIASRSYTGDTWGSNLKYISDTSSNTMVVGFGFRFGTNLYTSGYWFRIGRNDGSRYHQFFVDSSGYIYITSAGTLGSGARLFTFPSVVGLNTWYYMQIKMVSDPINGQLTVLMGNSVVCNLTGLNTACTGNIIDVFDWNLYSTAAYSLQIDDVYVLDGNPPTNDFIGVCSIAGATPVANGDRVDFEVVGSTEQWDAIDETTGDTTSYIYGDGVNEKALFQMKDVATSGEIKGVLLHDYAARSEEGQGWSKYRIVLKNESQQEWESDEITLPDSVQRSHRFLLEHNPFTDATQDQTTINNMQLGIRITQVD